MRIVKKNAVLIKIMWLLILCQIVTPVAANGDNFSSAYFITRENRRLAGHLVKKMESTSIMSCSHSCLRNSWCTSTNFKESVGQGDKGTCELNKHEFAPINDGTGKLIDEPGTTFTMMLKGCLMSGCLNGGSCLFDKEKETFSCSCKFPWIGDKCEVKQVDVFLFPQKTVSDYVIVNTGMPSLSALTACFWMKSTDTGNGGTPLSYAVHNKDNEFGVYTNYNFFKLGVGGEFTRTSISANDGRWHYTCATWENTKGSWKFYKNGTVGAYGQGFREGYVIMGGGALVLGQDQDSVGGSFEADQSFIGEMTGVNIWSRVLDSTEIVAMAQSFCMAGEGDVYKWSDFKSHRRGGVQLLNASCPV